MIKPEFNPNHHPILDTDPHEFVRMANARGIKLAVNTCYYLKQHECGCAVGVACLLALPPDADRPEWVDPGSLNFSKYERVGVVDGFDGDGDRWERGSDVSRSDAYQRGLAFGSAVRAAALEIQGDLKPTPLVKGGAS